MISCATGRVVAARSANRNLKRGAKFYRATFPAETRPADSKESSLVLQYDFEESIGYWLIIGAQAFQRALNEELAPHGVTFRQAQVLGWLALEGELSQNELAAKMMVEPPTLVGILDRMERDGWIARLTCPSDRRKKLVVINRTAEQVWEKIVACAKRVRARAVEGLSPAEIETLKQLVRRIQHNLSESAVIEKRL